MLNWVCNLEVSQSEFGGYFITHGSGGHASIVYTGFGTDYYADFHGCPCPFQQHNAESDSVPYIWSKWYKQTYTKLVSSVGVLSAAGKLCPSGFECIKFTEGIYINLQVEY